MAGSTKYEINPIGGVSTNEDIPPIPGVDNPQEDIPPIPMGDLEEEPGLGEGKRVDDFQEPPVIDISTVTGISIAGTQPMKQMDYSPEVKYFVPAQIDKPEILKQTSNLVAIHAVKAGITLQDLKNLTEPDYGDIVDKTQTGLTMQRKEEATKERIAERRMTYPIIEKRKPTSAEWVVANSFDNSMLGMGIGLSEKFAHYTSALMAGADQETS